MTFADLLYKGFQWIEGRFTRILGVISGSIAIIAGTTGIIPESQLKYWMLAIALLTFWRGHSTSKAYDQAKAVLASATGPTVVGPPIVMAQVKEAPIDPKLPPTGEKLG